MHRFVNESDILTSVTNEHDYDVIIVSGAWGDGFMNHHLNHMQRNHKLCLDNLEERYEYVFYTTERDYQKYKDRFIIPDITFIIGTPARLMIGLHMDYAYKRGRPMISLACDCLHTTNLLPNLLNKYGHYDVCGCASQRTYANVLDVISAKEQSMPYEDIFAPRELLRTYLPNLYGSELNYFADTYNAGYNGIFFPVRSNGELVGLIQRAFHFGVIYVKNPLPGASGNLGLDCNEFLTVLATPETTGMVADSDDGFCIDVMGHKGVGKPTPNSPNKPIFQDYWDSVRGAGVYPVNEAFMQYNVVLHSEPLNDDWLAKADEANNLITEVFSGAIENKPLTWLMLE